MRKTLRLATVTAVVALAWLPLGASAAPADACEPGALCPIVEYAEGVVSVVTCPPPAFDCQPDLNPLPAVEETIDRLTGK